MLALLGGFCLVCALGFIYRSFEQNALLWLCWALLVVAAGVMVLLASPLLGFLGALLGGVFLWFTRLPRANFVVDEEKK